MSKANKNFNGIEVKKNVFHNCKYPINIDKVAIEKSACLTRFHIVKKVLNTLLVKKNIKLNHCVQYFKK